MGGEKQTENQVGKTEMKNHENLSSSSSPAANNFRLLASPQRIWTFISALKLPKSQISLSTMDDPTSVLLTGVGPPPTKRPLDDDDKHEKAAAQFSGTGEDLGPTVGETYAELSRVFIALCCSGTNVAARNILMCCQPQPSRAYFLWTLVSVVVGVTLWFLSWDTARRALMLSKWSWWAHLVVPLVGLAVGAFGVYDVTDRELRDEEYSSSSRANCDRMMWRRGVAVLGVLIMLGAAMYVCNGIWFYVPDEDMQFLQEHKGNHHDHPSPPPSPPPADAGNSGVIPSWLKTPSRTRAPQPTPSPSIDPSVIVRLEQIEQGKMAQVGLYFVLAMASLSAAMFFNWKRQTVPHRDDAEYDASEGLIVGDSCCPGVMNRGGAE